MTEGKAEKPEKGSAISLEEEIEKSVLEKTGRSNKTGRDGLYTVGGYSFQTYYEYKNALMDVKKIDVIRNGLDLSDPEVALRLYNMIRDGRVIFRSEIGEEFTRHVSDIVAERSADLLEDKAVVDEADSRAKWQRVLALIVLAAACIAFFIFAFSQIKDAITARNLSRIRNKTSDIKTGTTAKNISSDESKITDSTVIYNEDTKKNVLPEFDDLIKKNPETVGWLKIEGTDIDFPVVQKDNDNQYYLSHSFDGNEDKNGSIFMDSRCSITKPTLNTIIYGHNMKSGMMFGKLSAFLKKDYYEKNRTIEFNTIYEKRKYEIIAVCLSEVAHENDSSFRYYDFIQPGTQGEWDQFHKYVAEKNIYGADIDMTNQDQLLTLSTCNDYMKDGRLFILAKRVE